VLLLKNFHIDNQFRGIKFKVWLLLSLAFTFFCLSSGAQNCPANIDFERGNFDGWTCYTGVTSAVGNTNVISLLPTRGPINGKHTMIGTNFNAVDQYGGFPVNCPNGSGHSVKLGSTEAGGQAEGMSYEFTIPANDNAYSLTYHYAVVFQDPNHEIYQQPRLEIEITNVTDNSLIYCSSFTFFPRSSISVPSSPGW